MSESEKHGKTKVHPQASLSTPQEKAVRVDQAYENLIAVLNKLGYYPKSREEAKKLAKALLKRGYTED